MDPFTTNIMIQNLAKSKKDETPVKENKQTVINQDILRKLKLIEKAFK